MVDRITTTAISFNCYYQAAVLPFVTSQKKRALRPFSLQISDNAAPEQRSKGMEALQANHERPANPHERALPFSTVHPYGLPCESRAKALGPTCLESIARNKGSNGKRNCDKLHFAGRRLPALANYFSKQVLKTILLSASLAFGALAPAAVEAASSCGYASHYGNGDGFAWQTMANGRPMDPNAMTSAHPSLPMGTKIRVVNPANGKSVNLVISDRGPYHGGRILDLSSGAFSRIASLEQGIAKVCFSRV